VAHAVVTALDYSAANRYRALVLVRAHPLSWPRAGRLELSGHRHELGDGPRPAASRDSA